MLSNLIFKTLEYIAQTISVLWLVAWKFDFLERAVNNIIIIKHLLLGKHLLKGANDKTYARMDPCNRIDLGICLHLACLQLVL